MQRCRTFDCNPPLRIPTCDQDSNHHHQHHHSHEQAHHNHHHHHHHLLLHHNHLHHHHYYVWVLMSKGINIFTITEADDGCKKEEEVETEDTILHTCLTIYVFGGGSNCAQFCTILQNSAHLPHNISIGGGSNCAQFCTLASQYMFLGVAAYAQITFTFMRQNISSFSLSSSSDSVL